jgi:hypothetical protein
MRPSRRIPLARFSGASRQVPCCTELTGISAFPIYSLPRAGPQT